MSGPMEQQPRSNADGGGGRSYRRRPSPLSIRLSGEERKALERLAANRPLGAYVKEALFGHRRASTCVSESRIAQVLAQLGASGLAASLATLAREAGSGNLFVDEATEKRILEACADVRAMRNDLLRALGKRDVGDGAESLGDAFNLGAGWSEGLP